MTFQPPPPPSPPGGTPPPPPPPPGGTPPPPPPGQWGVPASGGGSFDPKSVNQYDWGILGAGVLLFIFSFVSWYSYKVKGSVDGVKLDRTLGHWNAWHGFFGWFGVLCALIGSGLVALTIFAPQVKLPIAARLGALIAYAVAALCVILALFVIPGDTGGSYFGVHIDKGHSFGYWISLIIVLAGVVLTLMRAQQTNTALPGALNKVPKIGQ